MNMFLIFAHFCGHLAAFCGERSDSKQKLSGKDTGALAFRWVT